MKQWNRQIVGISDKQEHKKPIFLVESIQPLVPAQKWKNTDKFLLQVEKSGKNKQQITNISVGQKNILNS